MKRVPPLGVVALWDWWQPDAAGHQLGATAVESEVHALGPRHEGSGCLMRTVPSRRQRMAGNRGGIGRSGRAKDH